MAVLIMDITGYCDMWSPCYERHCARCYILLTLSHKRLLLGPYGEPEYPSV